MSELSASSVAEPLGLGPAYQPWLALLERVGPTAVSLPQDDEAERVLRQLGLAEPDLSAILATLPSPGGQPALWWLFERAVHAVRLDVGQPDTVRGWPSLPAHLGIQGRCFWVWVYVAAVPDIRRWHRAHGVADDVSWSTLADLGRHIRLYRLRTGIVGFDEQFWFALHFRGGIFELGRLQFNPYLLASGPAGPLFWYADEASESFGEGLRRGDPALGVHIPESGPLTPAACAASFQATHEFFADLFPAQTYRVATCTSWLMDDQLLDYLDADSNIVRFQHRFTLVPGARDADDSPSPVRFVFHRELAALDRLVPHTRLEHAIVNHLAAGKHWRMRTGWLRL